MPFLRKCIAFLTTRRDWLLLGLLSVLYLIPGVVVAIHSKNPFDWYAQAAFIVIEYKLDCALSLLAILCVLLLLIFSRNIFLKTICFLAILLPLFSLYVLIPD